MMNSHLTPEGQQRRDEILTLILAESRRLQRRRKRRLRVGGAATIVLIVTAVMWPYWQLEEPTSVRVRSRSTPGKVSSPFDLNLESHIVGSDVDDLGQYLVQTREELPEDVLLDDTELLHELADMGQVDGIIRADGKAWLTSELESRLAFQE